MYPWDSLHPAWSNEIRGQLHYTLVCDSISEWPLAIHASVEVLSDDCVSIWVSVGNKSTRSYEYCWADACLQFKHAPEFQDLRGERCVLDTDQGFVSADRWPRSTNPHSWSPDVQAYRVQGFTPPYPYGVVQGLAAWSVSPSPLRSGLVMMARRDGEWHVGFGWDQSASVAHNPDAEHHCIHSDPWYGAIPSGQSITRQGTILIVRGEPQTVKDRYGAWLTAMNGRGVLSTLARGPGSSRTAEVGG